LDIARVDKLVADTADRVAADIAVADIVVDMGEDIVVDMVVEDETGPAVA